MLCAVTFEFEVLGRPLTDGVVTIRDRVDADVPVLVAGRDAESARFLGPEHPDPDPLAVIEVAGQVIGWIDYDVGRPWLVDGEVNVGYGTFPQHRGKGHVQRALRLLCSVLDERPGFSCATLLIDEANAPSLAIAEACGFVEAPVADTAPPGERFFRRYAQSPFSAERAYYEEEAARGVRSSPTGFRVRVRDDFIRLLVDEGRSSVLDIGAGPATDGDAFAAAGIRYVGLDLAHGNAVLASRRGLDVVVASLDTPPFAASSFDAMYSMSTLMHVPEALVTDALGAMVESVVSGAPVFIGLWGGPTADHHPEGLDGHRRRFRHRPLERNVELADAVLDDVVGEVRHPEGHEHEYQIIRARVR